MNLSVKLFVNDEVRRFLFNGSTFAELYSACTALNTTTSSGTLQYYDDEGDYVNFSSDPEFQYALSFLKEPRVLRLRLQPLVTTTAVANPVDDNWRSRRHRKDKDDKYDGYKYKEKPHKEHHHGEGHHGEGHKHKREHRIKDLDARFVAHVNYDDGTKVPPGFSFVKTWILRNNGAIRWPEGTSLTRIDRANDLKTVEMTPYTGPLPAPGAEAQVSVKMESPALNGEYSSYFKMVSPGGKKFGQRMRCQIIVQGEKGAQ